MGARAEAGKEGVSLDEVVIIVRRVGGGKPDPMNPVKFMDHRQKFRKGGKTSMFLAVCVDILTEKNDLLGSRLKVALDLCEDDLGRTADLPPPGERDDAETAHLIAPFLDCHIGNGRGTCLRVWLIEAGDLVEVPPGGGDKGLSGSLDPLEMLIEGAHLVGSKDEIHMGCSFEKALPFLLGNTAGDNQDPSFLFSFPSAELTQGGVKFVFCFFSDRTCIDQNKICIFRGFRG
jgi:hypothetical protein